jgi:hypothetical protein
MVSIFPAIVSLPRKLNRCAAARYELDQQYDLDGRVLANRTLPFGPCIMGSCKVVEGTFSDALQTLTLDIEEASKQKANRQINVETSAPKRTYTSDKPIVYLSGFERYDNDAVNKYAIMKAVLEKHGFDKTTSFRKMKR